MLQPFREESFYDILLGPFRSLYLYKKTRALYTFAELADIYLTGINAEKILDVLRYALFIDHAMIVSPFL
jgi:hypothetical protein